MGNGRKNAEWFIQTADTVNRLPIMKVAEPYLEEVRDGQKLIRCGAEYNALCPFHPDTRVGSFKVSESKNLAWCFSCGKGGGPVRFTMEILGLSFKEAVLRLAWESGIITDEEYKKKARVKIDDSVIREARKEIEAPPHAAPRPKADDDVIWAVYSAIPRVCQLSKAHRDHLTRERGLPADALGDYFTFPTRRMDLAGKAYRDIAERVSTRKYGKPLKALGTEEREKIEKSMARARSQMECVPGFFRDTRTGHVDFSSVKGIGIVARDADGHPCGIQVRRDRYREGESRYVWFSSSFAWADPSLAGGASPGCPGGVVYPAGGDNDRAALCITEGRFKAEKIAAAGNTAIYVSGVSTWQAVLPLVGRLKGRCSTVFLVFDADSMGNTAVHQQLGLLARALWKEGLKARVVLWRKEHGKGFDDLVLAKGSFYPRFLKYVTYAEYEAVHRRCLKECLAHFGTDSPRGIKKEQAGAFIRMLQETTEEALGLPRD